MCGVDSSVEQSLKTGIVFVYHVNVQHAHPNSSDVQHICRKFSNPVHDWLMYVCCVTNGTQWSVKPCMHMIACIAIGTYYNNVWDQSLTVM